MTDIWPTIYPRDLSITTPITPETLTYAVQRYSWNVLGGPDRCVIQAKGSVTALFELLEMLRCPLTVYSRAAWAVWWGYISKVTIRSRMMEIGVTLDSMSNSVAVAYSYVDASTQIGTRKTTAWATDAESISEYGTKELLMSLGGASDNQALQMRDTALSIYRYPQATWVKGYDSQEIATIEARGWWSTLGWRMLNVSTTNNVETTTQIANALDSKGQFIAGREIETVSGISTNEYRDGDTTALAEIEDLLISGTSGGMRLAATVTPERIARIFAEPAQGAGDYYMDRAGQVYDAYQNKLTPGVCPVGIWLELSEVVPATVNVSKLASPQAAFIDRSEYDVARGIYAPLSRGVPSPWEIVKSVYG